jgi:hypothetical protein
MTNIQRNSNKDRKRRNKTQKRVAEYRHQSKIQNNRLSFERIQDKPTYQDKPSIKHPVISIEARLRKLVEISPEVYSALSVFLKDHTFIIDNGCLFNSNSDLICAMPEQLLRRKRIKTAYK